MANYTTVDDLKADALFRAGEPTDGTSEYDTLVVTYMNAAQLGLCMGGPLGLRQRDTLINLPVIDWHWQRSWPPTVIPLSPVINAAVGTLVLAQGSNAGTISAPPAYSLAGWYLQAGTSDTVPRIASHTGGESAFTLDATWPDADVSQATDYKIMKLEYDLASDFLRFIDRIRLPVWPYKMQIVDEPEMDARFPLSVTEPDTPHYAALIGPQKIRLSRAPTEGLNVSYVYVHLPSDLAAGGTPDLPRHHRRILSCAAAGRILLDKSDSKAQALGREMQAMLEQVVQEHNHMQRKMATHFGQILPRNGYPRLRLFNERDPYGAGSAVGGGYGGGGYGEGGYGE